MSTSRPLSNERGSTATSPQPESPTSQSHVSPNHHRLITSEYSMNDRYQPETGKFHNTILREETTEDSMAARAEASAETAAAVSAAGYAFDPALGGGSHSHNLGGPSSYPTPGRMSSIAPLLHAASTEYTATNGGNHDHLSFSYESSNGKGKEVNDGSDGRDDDGDDGSVAGEAGKSLKNTKRAAQNRAAQRAFRERKEQYVRDLERKSAMLDETVARERDLHNRLAAYEMGTTSVSAELNRLSSERDAFAAEKAAFIASRESWSHERAGWALERNQWQAEKEGWIFRETELKREIDGLKGALGESRRQNTEFMKSELVSREASVEVGSKRART